jgi:type II secretory pathway component PulF
VASNAAPLGVGAALLIGACILAMRFPTGRAALASVLRRVPILGEIAHLSAVVQFARMLALLERAGLPLLETLRVVERMLPSGPVKRLAASMRTQVGAGSSLAAAVSGAGVLPDMLEHMISVGEEAGRIDETLFAAAGYLEEELRARIHGLTIALEPALTILVSAMVMFVALAIFLPLWDTPSLLLHS